MSSPRPTATVLKLVSNFDIAGQSYTTTVKALDKNGNKTSLEYEGMTGTPYGSFFYSSGALTGTQKTFRRNQRAGVHVRTVLYNSSGVAIASQYKAIQANRSRR